MNWKGSEEEEWQAGEQQTGERDEVECGQRLGQPLVVPRESAEARGPGKRAPSRQRESHPLPLTEPAVRLSV
jgi:hypothetical protein